MTAGSTADSGFTGHGVWTWLLVLSLCAPLVYSDAFLFPYVIPRTVFFRGIVALTALGLALEWSRGTRRPPGKFPSPVRDPVFGALTAFVLLAAISSLLGEAPARSLWGDLERMTGVLGWVSYLLFYLLLRVTLSEDGWLVVLRAAVAVGVLAAVIALLDHAGRLPFPLGASSSRPAGTLGNPGYLSAFLALGGSLAAYLAIRERRRILRVALYLPAVILQLLVAVMAGTRAVYLGIGVGVLILGVSVALFSRGSRRRWAGGAIAAAVLGSGLALWWMPEAEAEGGWLGRLAAMSMDTESFRTRSLAWTAAIEGFRDAPVFGAGLENFTLVWSRHFEPLIYNIQPRATEWDRAHNAFIGTAATTGILGWMAFTAVWGLLGRTLYRAWRVGGLSAPGVLALGGGVTVYVVYLAFWFTDLSSMTLILVIAGYAAHRLEAAGGGPSPGPTRSDGAERTAVAPTGRWPMAGIAVAFFLAVAWHDGRALRAAHLTYAGEYSDDAWHGTRDFGAALKSDLPGSRAILDAYLRRLTYLAIVGPDRSRESGDGRMEEALGRAEGAVESWEERDPANPHVYLREARICDIRRRAFPDGDSEGCVESSLGKAIELSPSRLRYRHMLADHFLSTNQPARASRVMASALRVYDSWGESYAYLARVQWRLGKREDASESAAIAVGLGHEGQSPLFLVRLSEWMQREGRASEAADLLGAHVELRYPEREDISAAPPRGWRLPPGEAPLLSQLAILSCRTGRTETAVRAVRLLERDLRSRDGDANLVVRLESFIEDARDGECEQWERREGDLLHRSADETAMIERPSVGRSAASTADDTGDDHDARKPGRPGIPGDGRATRERLYAARANGDASRPRAGDVPGRWRPNPYAREHGAGPRDGRGSLTDLPGTDARDSGPIHDPGPGDFGSRDSSGGRRGARHLQGRLLGRSSSTRLDENPATLVPVQ